MRIEPITPNTGARISGVDLRTIDDRSFAEIEAALHDHLVLFFVDQHLGPDAQHAFAHRFGDIDVAPFGPKHPDRTDMTVLDQDAPKGQGADAWHSDNTYLAEPPKITMLQAVQLPPGGGDTCWSNMYLAYETLSEPIQTLLDGLTATHDLAKMLATAIRDGNSHADPVEMAKRYPPVNHPVVRTHPVTGRKGLFVNGNFTTHINGLSNAESRHLLDLLYAHIQTPELVCRYRWEPGTLAVWDNRCLQHYAVPDYTSRRIMHRFTIAGDRPE
jgi:taurine dioxygenase